MKRYYSIDEALSACCDDLLSPDEEQLLLATIKEKGMGCEEIDMLLRSNMRFIVSVANQYNHKGVDLVDLIWVAQNAFCDAAHQYDPATNTRYIDLAVRLSRTRLIDALRTSA